MALDLKWLLSADDKATPVFDKFHQNAKQATDGVSNAMTTIGSGLNGLIGVWGTLAGVVAGGAALKAVISETISWTGESVKLSKALGITTEQASILNVALGDVYLTHEDMTAANSRMTRTLANNEDAFKKLGVATRDQTGNYRSSVDIMADVNAKLLTIKEGTDRNIAGTQIYGRGWQEVSSILKLTPEVMREAQEKAERLHLIVGPEGVEKMKQYKAMMNDLEDVHKSFTVQIGNELLPILIEMGVEFGDLGIKAAGLFAELIKGTREMAVATRGSFGNPLAAGKDFLKNLFGGMSLKDAVSEFRAELGAFDQLTAHQVTAIEEGRTKAKKAGATERYKAEEEANKKELALLDKQLAAYKAGAERESVIAKEQAGIQAALLKERFDKGLVATRDYYDQVEEAALAAAQREVEIATGYLHKEQEVMATVRAKYGEASEEFQSQKAKEEKAIEGVQNASLKYARIFVDTEAQTYEALRKVNDAYDDQITSVLELSGRFVAAEQRKQDALLRSVGFIRMMSDAEVGNRNAVEALAASERKRSVDQAAAQVKEAEGVRQHQQEIAKLRDELALLDGADKELIDSEGKLRDGRDKLAQIQDRLSLAWAKGNTAEITALSSQIQMQEQLNARLQAEITLRQRKGELTGEIVGYNGDMPIFADWFQRQQAANGYVSNSQLTGTSTVSVPRSNPFGIPLFTDVNGNPVPGFASGTPYVPRTGLALIHQGERIIPAEENRSGNFGNTINFGGVSIPITVVSGGNATADAREIARQVAPELEKLLARQRAA
jgi:hypothetical protein